MKVPCMKCRAPHGTLHLGDYTLLRLCEKCKARWDESLVLSEVNRLVQGWVAVKIPMQVVDTAATEE
jgi:hypothetical protein